MHINTESNTKNDNINQLKSNHENLDTIQNQSVQLKQVDTQNNNMNNTVDLKYN